MEILNLATSALLNSLEKNGIDKTRLLDGTTLSMNELSELKKKHSWNDFVKMYENCAHLLGHERAAKEIAYNGIYNDNISLIMKVGKSFIDQKVLYWYTSTFVTKHLYKDCIKFNYSNPRPNVVVIKIEINEDLKECPLLLETYIYLFEILPSVLGHPKANVNASISANRGVYEIKVKKAQLFKKIYARISALINGNTSSVILMDQLESQSEELSIAVEEKSKLLRVVSHDVSNQVITLNYYLDKLLESSMMSDEDKKSVVIAKNSTSKLFNILRNIQNMEATSARGILLSPVLVADVFKSLNDDFKPQLNHKAINLVFNNQLDKDTKILIERSSFEINVLGNLVTNAIKFSPIGSTIEIRALLIDDHVLISVIDEGVGIDAKEIATIFTKKIRRSSIGTSGELGTGFGLGIVASYVKMFQGDIKVKARYPVGTIFDIKLRPYYD